MGRKWKRSVVGGGENPSYFVWFEDAQERPPSVSVNNRNQKKELKTKLMKPAVTLPCCTDFQSYEAFFINSVFR
jgi:hypothetical protein